MADPDDSEALEADSQSAEGDVQSTERGSKSAVAGSEESGDWEVSIDSPDLDAVDALVDLWVALASDQRAHDSHVLPDENRAVVRDTLARHAVTGGIRVARRDGDIVGFVTFGIERGAYEQDETRGVVRNVYVDPTARGDGIGTALMDAAESSLRAAGATVLSLEAMAANRRAREFYRERGYEPHRVQFEKPADGGAVTASDPPAENDTHSKED